MKTNAQKLPSNLSKMLAAAATTAAFAAGAATFNPPTAHAELGPSGVNWTGAGGLSWNTVEAWTVTSFGGTHVPRSGEVVYIDNGAGNGPLVSNAAIASVLYVGWRESGSLTISAGGILSDVGVCHVGEKTDSVGVINVTGAGARLETYNGAITLGEYGRGTLNISGGGYVSGIGVNLNSPDADFSRLIVTGDGSHLKISGGLLNRLDVGRGIVLIEENATITSDSGRIGSEDSTTYGDVTVTGNGSLWNVSQSIYLGCAAGGTGSLLIKDGGRVIAGSVDLHGDGGEVETARATTTVRGVGSTLQAGTGIVISRSDLLIENGGAVSSDYGKLENGGRATVTGTDAFWKNTTSLNLYSGSTLSISNGGRVESETSNLNNGTTVNIIGANSQWTVSGDINVSSDAKLHAGTGGKVSASAMNVTGGVLCGGGIVAGGVNFAYGTLSVGSTHADVTVTVPETLTIIGGLSFDGDADIQIDLYSGNASDKLVVTSLSATDGVTLHVDINTILDGTYTVATATGTGIATAFGQDPNAVIQTTVAGNSVNPGAVSYKYSADGKSLILVVGDGGDPNPDPDPDPDPVATGARIWTGATNLVWNSADQNWKNTAGIAAAFTAETFDAFFDGSDAMPADAVILLGNVEGTGSVRAKSVTISGDKNYAFQGESIGVAGKFIKNGNGILDFTGIAGANDFAGGLEVNGGVLRFNKAAQLGTQAIAVNNAGLSAAGGAGTLVLDAPTTYTGNVAWNVDAGTTAKLGAAHNFSPAEKLTKTGDGELQFAGAVSLKNLEASGGKTIFGADAALENLTLKGALEIAGGTTVLQKTGSILGGTISGAGTFRNDGILAVAAPANESYDITGGAPANIVNNGTIVVGVPQDATRAFKFAGTFVNNGTLQFANLGRIINLDTISGDGVIRMEVNSDTGETDRLVVSSASGRQRIILTDLGRGISPAAVGEVLALNNPLVEYTGTGTIAPGTFTGGLDSAGSRFALTSADGTAWNLVYTGPTNNAQAALNTIGAMSIGWFTQLDNIVKRMGELHAGGVDKGAAAAGSNDFWVRGYGSQIDAKLGIEGLSEFREYQYGADIGYDRMFAVDAENTVFAGAFIGYQGATRRFRDETGSRGSTDSIQGGVYATWLHADGWYADGVLKGQYFDNEYKADGDKADFDNAGIGVSLEIGKQWKSADGWFVEPSLQFAYAHIFAESFTSRDDLRVNGSDSDIYRFAAAVRAGKFIEVSGNRIQPYVKAGVEEQVSSGGSVRIEDVKNRPNTDGTRAILGAGIVWQLDAASQIHFEYEAALGDKYDKPWGLNAGYRMRF